MDDNYAPTLGARKTNEDRTVTFEDNEVRKGQRWNILICIYKGRPNNIELPVERQ